MITWFSPPLRMVWGFIDAHVYLALNGSLEGHYYLQQVIAWLNSRYGDWLFEVSIISMYLLSIRRGNAKERLFRLLSVVVCIALFQIIINKILCFKILRIARESPSLVLGTIVDLSVFTYPNNKIASSYSFPADHATTIFMCALFSWSHFRKPVALLVSVASILFALPRLISGAHWFTDVLFGGVAFAIVAWIAMSSFSRWYRSKIFS